MATLGDFITIKHGYSFKGTEITTEDNGVVLVTPGNFAIGGGFKEEKCKFFNGEYPVEYVLSPDDLIVTMTDLSKDMDTLGYSALIPFSGRTYLHNQRIGLINIKEESVDKHYLYWFMRTHKYQRTIAGGASGTTVHHTSPTRICEIEVDFPDIETQQSIAMILGALDDKIALNQQINKNLEEQAQAIFDSFYKEATDIVPFTSLIQVLSGGTPKTTDETFWNGDIPFFTPKDVGSPFTITTEKYITSAGLDHCNSRLYPVNTTFVTARGTVGKVSLSGVPMAMNQSCYALASDELHPMLTYFYTLKTVQSLRHKASGAVFDAITISDFKTETLNRITGEASSKVLALIAPMMENVLQNSMENIRLAATRDALLPRLMSGEIDVSMIEI